MLSQGQLALLAEHGEERRADVGDVLFQVGDRRYPLIAIIEGEAAILDAAGARSSATAPSGFLGETNLLSGPDGLPDGRRDPADALHRRRA